MLVGVVGVLYSEPWPAFVLPGFKSVYASEEQVKITTPQFFVKWGNSSERKEIAPSELFSGLQTSQMQGFIQSNFTQKDYDLEARKWLKNRLMHMYPDSSVAALEVAWTPVTYQQIGDTLKIQDGPSTRTITIPFNNR